MQILKHSNYSADFRKEILKSGFRGYNKILDNDKKGIKPMYRPKEWRRASRRMDNQTKKKLG